MPIELLGTILCLSIVCAMLGFLRYLSCKDFRLCFFSLCLLIISGSFLANGTLREKSVERVIIVPILEVEQKDGSYKQFISVDGNIVKINKDSYFKQGHVKLIIYTEWQSGIYYGLRYDYEPYKGR